MTSPNDLLHDSSAATYQKIATLEDQLNELKRIIFQEKFRERTTTFPISALVTRIDEFFFAFSLEVVVEAIYMVVVSPLPGAPYAVRGAINYRGDIVPVLDLSVGFLKEPLELRAQMYLIIISLNEKLYALPVHQLYGVSSFEETDVKPISESTILTPLVECVLHSEYGALSLINPERLLAAGEYDLLDKIVSNASTEEIQEDNATAEE